MDYEKEINELKSRMGKLERNPSEYKRIPQDAIEAWEKLPLGRFTREEVDISPIILEELVWNNLVEKIIVNVTNESAHEKWIYYSKL